MQLGPQSVFAFFTQTGPQPVWQQEGSCVLLQTLVAQDEQSY